MAALLRTIFGGRQPPRVPPPRVPTDEVFPLHEFDGRPQVRNIIMGWTMRFDDVLDADKLHVSLAQLLEIGSWRKLGGRLRQREDGELEIHVPAEFTPKRPAVRFSHDKYNIKIRQHALASRLPHPTDGVSLQEGADTFEPFATPDDAPRSLEDFLNSDDAQLGLHVISFTDATLVSMTWPHTLSDALGMQAIVNNWAKVLAGREDEVTPLLGADDDVLATVGKGEVDSIEEPWALKDKVLKGFGTMWFVLNMIWDTIWIGPREHHMIYLPAHSVLALRETAMTDLAAHQNGSSITDKKPFLTENDVLTAWMTRMAVLDMPTTSTRTIAFLNFFEIRSRLPTVFSPSGAYVSNFVFASWAHITVQEALTAPLGVIAMKYRTFLAEQTTEGQIRGMLRFFRHQMAAGGRMAAMPPDSMLLTCTNWTKAKLFDLVDFGPAVVRAGTPFGTTHEPGRPVYFHAVNVKPLPGDVRWRQQQVAVRRNRPKTRSQNGINILGKDAGGNYWIMAILPPTTWPEIEKVIRTM